MRITIAILSVLLLASCGTIRQVHTGDVHVCDRTEMKMYSVGQYSGINIEYANQEIHRYSGDELIDYVKQCHTGLKATRRNFTGVRDDMQMCGFNIASSVPIDSNIASERFQHAFGGYVLLYKVNQNGREYICPYETGRWR